MGEEPPYLSSTPYVVAIILGIPFIAVAIALVIWNFLSFWDASKPNTGKLWWIPLMIGGALVAWGQIGLRQLSHAKAAKKIIIADKEVRLYKEMDSHSPLIAILVEGGEVQARPPMEVNGVDWIKVTLPDGREGFIIGCARICVVLQAVIVSQTLARIVFNHGSPPEEVLLNAGTEIDIAESDWDATLSDKEVYVRAWLPDRQRVYIRSDAQVEWV